MHFLLLILLKIRNIVWSWKFFLIITSVYINLQCAPFSQKWSYIIDIYRVTFYIGCILELKCKWDCFIQDLKWTLKILIYTRGFKIFQNIDGCWHQYGSLSVTAWCCLIPKVSYKSTWNTFLASVWYSAVNTRFLVVNWEFTSATRL